ncbi:hypothetical protein ACWD8L_41260 [Streptomyces sp. NPDC005133]
MSKPDELLVDVAALVESGQSNRMSLTVVTGGAVITGRLAPEAVWRPGDKNGPNEMRRRIWSAVTPAQMRAMKRVTSCGR